MGLLKPLLYVLATPLLASCALWHSVPPKVVEGQRGIYQGLTVIEENMTMILDTYEQDNKAAITYHVNFVYEQRIDKVRKDSSLSDEQRLESVASLENDRDKEIKDTFSKIEQRREEMAQVVSQNVLASKKLTEAIYGYLSSTPITVDNVDFWIEKIVTVGTDHGRK